MERFTNKIYSDFLRYNPLVSYIPKEDVKQEIRFAILTARPEQVYRVAGRLINALCRDYGYSRKKGKDAFDAFYIESTISEEDQSVLDDIDEIYRGENLTAREVATRLGCEYNQAFQKLMHLCFPKQAGHGGARKGSGQKKKIF